MSGMDKVGKSQFLFFTFLFSQKVENFFHFVLDMELLPRNNSRALVWSRNHPDQGAKQIGHGVGLDLSCPCIQLHRCPNSKKAGFRKAFPKESSPFLELLVENKHFYEHVPRIVLFILFRIILWQEHTGFNLKQHRCNE